MCEDRILNDALRKKVMSAEEAAAMISPGDTLGLSGFTMASYPKMVPLALAKRGYAGEKLDLTLVSGASVGVEVDSEMVKAGVVSRRYSFLNNKDLRNAANSGDVAFVDINLGEVPQFIKQGVFGEIDYAIIEASSIDEEGRIIPAMSIGAVDALVQKARHVIVELNTLNPVGLKGIHDVYTPKMPPDTEPIPLRHVMDRIGTSYVPCDPDKIAAIVFSEIPDTVSKMTVPDENIKKIADNLLLFLRGEIAAGRLPEQLPPLQSGIGSVGNAILEVLSDSDLRGLYFYSEVLQNSILDLIDKGVVKGASATSLVLFGDNLEKFRKNVDYYKTKIVIRPQELSNGGEIIRRLGVIAINTAIEIDLSGNVNSTHIGGSRLMNGIGGSADYSKNAWISIFVTQSTAKNGTLSCIVPYVQHVDSTEHDVDVVITEQGFADLRCKTAYERAELLISYCAAPEYKGMLRDYLERCKTEGESHHGIPILK